MQWPRFTLSELLLSITLIGVGLGCFLLGFSCLDWRLWNKRQAIMPYAYLAALLGPLGVFAMLVGILIPFHAIKRRDFILLFAALLLAAALFLVMFVGVTPHALPPSWPL